MANGFLYSADIHVPGNSWQVVLLNQLCSTFDSAHEANFVLRQCYKPDEDYKFNNGKKYWSIKAKYLTPALINDVFALKALFDRRNQEIADELQRIIEQPHWKKQRYDHD